MLREEGEMALSGAERQARFRERMRAEGKKRQDEWIVEGAGFAEADKGRDPYDRAWPHMTKEQLNGCIRKAVAEFAGEDEFIKNVVYAEIAAYAVKAAARYRKYNEHAKKLLRSSPK
jgi:hypothetical protein